MLLASQFCYLAKKNKEKRTTPQLQSEMNKVRTQTFFLQETNTYYLGTLE